MPRLWNLVLQPEVDADEIGLLVHTLRTPGHFRDSWFSGKQVNPKAPLSLVDSLFIKLPIMSHVNY